MTRRFILPLAALCGLVSQAAAAPFISEFLASNKGLDTDDRNESSDWIEIHNPEENAVSLAGWSLTDDAADRAKWVFPAVEIPGKGFLVVRASGKNLRTPPDPLHTNFSLDAGGEYLALFPPTGAAAREWAPYPRQFGNVSYGFPTGGGAAAWLAEPTPGEENYTETFKDYVRDTNFDVPRGFLDAPAAVSVTTETPGAVIRYTVDGSEPTAETGTLYTGPITVSTTTSLRVRAFRPGFVPTNTDTRTYIFPNTWLTQPTAPAGFPFTWGNTLNRGALDPNVGVLADYSMDPAVTSDPGMRAALTSTLPVLCLTGAVDDIFGTQGVMGNGRMDNTEKPVAVEFFDPLKPEAEFSARAGMQAHGAAVVQFAKKALRLDFSGKDGDGALQYPLFPGSAVETFDQLVLRTGGHDSFTARARDFTSIDQYDLAFHATYMRDQFLRRTEVAMGLLSPRGRYVHLCINGLYWGLYDLHERPNAEFAALHEGGAPEDQDVLHHTSRGVPGSEVLDGNVDAWNEVAALCSDADTPQKYTALTNLTGPDSLIDHLIARIWAGDQDWLAPGYMPGIDGVNPTGNIAYYEGKNWYALRRSRGELTGQWRFFTWDGEISMGSTLLFLWAGVSSEDFPDNFQWPVSQRRLDLDYTAVSTPGTPAEPWAALMLFPEYRLRVADRLRRHFFNGGALSPETAKARAAAMVSELDGPILAESARWGDVSGYNIAFQNGRLVQVWTNTPLKRDQHWRPEAAWVRDVFCVQRRDVVLNQFRARGIYPAVDAADIAPFGGALSAGATVTLTPPAGGGVVWYALDGTDPRVPGTGVVAPGAVLYAAPVVPPLSGSFTLKCRVLSGGVWSALTEAVFSRAVAPLAANLSITEVHYHPANPTPAETALGFTEDGQFEFLEVSNVSSAPVSLAGLRFAAGIDFEFPAAASGKAELDSLESFLIAADAAAFTARYGFAPDGVFANGTRLSNGGEQLKLVTADGAVIADFEYRDNEEWPAADGTGRSLTLLAPGSGTAERLGENWRAAAPSPGAVAETMTYASWKEEHFTAQQLANAVIAGNEADPDGDGIPNLVEFVTKSDPWRTGRAALLWEPEAGGDVSLSFELSLAAGGVEAVLRESPDLIGWSPWSEPSQTNPTDRAVVIRKFPILPAGPTAKRRFYRLDGYAE